MSSRTVVFAMLAAGLAAGCASANPDQPGGTSTVTYSSWAGTIAAPDGEPQHISYVIRIHASDWCVSQFRGPCENFGRILLPSSTEEGGEIQVDMTDAEWDGETLRYSWTDPEGTQIRCELDKQSSTLLAGDCSDSSGVTKARMTMSTPPGRLD